MWVMADALVDTGDAFRMPALNVWKDKVRAETRQGTVYCQEKENTKPLLQSILKSFDFSLVIGGIAQFP